MVYKKYIKKNGKLYGPYYYKSKRVNGKVISEYHGSERENLSKKKFNLDNNKLKKMAFIFLGLFFLTLGTYFLLNINSNSSPLSGFSVLNLNADYTSGEDLEGSLSLILNEGELLPASSQIVFETSNESYNYSLQEVVSDEKIVGDFYFAGGNISGEGIGYGIEGDKVVYPKLFFTLIVSEKISEEESLEREILGNVSKNDSFVYELKENETAEIKYLSVENSEGEELPDEILNLEIVNNTAIVSTDYSGSESGFGEEYIGENIKEISIDLSKLNLSLSDPNIKVKVTYLGSTLVDLSTQLQEEISEEDSKKDKKKDNLEENETSFNESDLNESETETIEEPLEKTFSDEIDSFYVLSENDKEVLRENFPNSSIEITKSVLKNSRIFIKYELGKYWFEATYDSDSSNESIQEQMDLDKTRWLKDIIIKINTEDSSEVEISEFLGEYSF